MWGFLYWISFWRTFPVIRIVRDWYKDLTFLIWLIHVGFSALCTAFFVIYSVLVFFFLKNSVISLAAFGKFWILQLAK